MSFSITKDATGHGVRSGHCHPALFLLLFTLPATAQTNPPPLPDALQPGAIRQETAPRLPPQPAAPVLSIPPLVERPLSAEEGDRVFVRRFELQDAQDRPEYGINLAAIQQLLETARQEYPDGFTIGQLEAVTNRITNHYRSRGLILARAVLPVQTVSDGVVIIQVVEGHLGQVLAEGNSLYSRETLARPFRQLEGKPVSQQQAESALLTLTDFPGLAAFGMFQPGRRVGEADLLIRVPNEEPFNASLRLDNHGTETTGEYRGRATLSWNNLTDNADRLTLTAQHSLQPANSLYGALDYQVILGRYWQAGGYARYNTFSVGGDFESMDIEGESLQAGGYVLYQWVRSRERNLSTRIELASKSSSSSRLGQQADEDRLTLLTLGINYDSVDTRFGGLNYAGLEMAQGFNDLLGAMGSSEDAMALAPGKRPSRTNSNSSRYAEGDFTRLLVFYSRLQNLWPGTSLLLRTELQYSPDLLVPMEQYAVGGAEHVRGFSPSYTLYDSGALFSLEYIWQPGFLNRYEAFGNWRWNDLVQLAAFYDHSFGEKNQPKPTDPQGRYQLSSLGVGIRFTLPNQLASRLQLALPVTDESRDDDEEKAKPQLWFDIAYHF